MSEAREPDVSGPERDDEQIAAQQFVHGLLSLTQEGERAARAGRIQAVLARIDDELAQAEPAAGQRLRAGRGARARSGVEPERHEVARRRWGSRSLYTSLAATLIALLGLFFGVFSGESAQALVSQSLAASVRTDRRYALTIELDPALKQDPHRGLLDYRDCEHFVLYGPHSEFAIGQGPSGPWLRRLDGSIERLSVGDSGDPADAPIGIEQTLALVEGLDALFAGLGDAYRFEIGESRPLEGLPGRYRRVTGEACDARGLFADHIELWIEARSLLLQRLVLSWDSDAGDSLHPFPHRVPIDMNRIDPHPGEGERIEETLGVAPKRMSFDLLENLSFEEGWFDPLPR